MTEHVHEWGMYKHKGGGATCKCGAVINNPTIEARLNATERLSAETAKNLLEAYKTGQINIYFAMSTIRSTLQAYADILEGKHD